MCMQLILNTKCHAIRDLQVAEKDEISKETEEEQVQRLSVCLSVSLSISLHVCVCVHTVHTYDIPLSVY